MRYLLNVLTLDLHSTLIKYKGEENPIEQWAFEEFTFHSD